MTRFKALLKKAYENVYDLSLQENYSGPFIYDADGKLFDDAGKAIRWYVYYSYRNPKTGNLERQNPISYGVNRFKDAAIRSKAIERLSKAVEEILKGGYNPFVDEAFAMDITKLSIAQAFRFVREMKIGDMADTSYTDFKSRLNQFEVWLLLNGFKDRTIDQVNKKAVMAYLNGIQKKTSNKNRNNTRTAIQTFFQLLEDNEYVIANFVDSIPVLTTKPKRNKTFTVKQEIEIFEYVQQNDPILLLFIKFLCFGMLRPIEICRLKVQDVNISERKIYLKAKNQVVKIKIIPEILLTDIPDLSKFDGNSFLFTRYGLGQQWDIKEAYKRDYFTDRFRKAKDHFNLDVNYGMYGFRHTFITKIYNSLLASGLTPFEAKSKLMLITGHKSMAALDKYLRDIDAVLPDDFSHHIKS